MGQKLAVLQQVPQTRSKEKPAWKGNPPNKKTAQVETTACGTGGL